MEARRAHNPEVVGSSPASATIKAPVFELNTGVFLTFAVYLKMPMVPFWVTFGSLGSKTAILGHAVRVSGRSFYAFFRSRTSAMHSEALALFSSMMWEFSWTSFSMVGVGFLSLISMLGFVVFNSHRAPTVESTRCSTKIIPQKFLIWKMLLSQMLKIFLTYFIFIWNYPGKNTVALPVEP